jgi:CDP-paratose 2-epimerase
MTIVAAPRVHSPAFGFAEWFRRGERDRVIEAVKGMRGAGATFLRSHLSWAEYHAPGGQEWFDWLIPILAADFDLLPCVHYTPPSLSRTGRSSGPPVRLKDYADFVDHVLSRYGEHFGHVELWNEPNNLLDWDWREDHDWLLFCEMVGNAAYWVEHRGWKAVLGGPSPFDPHWLSLMGERGVLGVASAVGFHGFPGTWDSESDVWQGYAQHLTEMRSVLDRYNKRTEIWITEAGYSTWRNDEAEQVTRFAQALAAPADRLYWYGWQDIPRDIPVQEGVYFDPRHYHLGVTDAQGRPKLLRRLLEQRGAQGLRTMPGTASPALAGRAAPIVVVGGAGFIGSNLADALLRDGEDVLVLDNLSRPGVERNLAWLQGLHRRKLHPCLADIRDETALREVVSGAKAIFHMAAQVAVTSSLVDPAADFSTNALGTLSLLESVRKHAAAAPVIFASTNKVYGALSDVRVVDFDGRYLPKDQRLRSNGVDETRALDFCTPYGCSKGSADQYVLDYAHTFGLRTAVLRMSCIYGPRQFGTEDQGWVAHFLIKALRNEHITVYGDGKQVRDVLHVGDAVAAYRLLLDRIDDVSGRAFNLGGGPGNAVSVNAVLAEIAEIAGHQPQLARGDWRTGDQLYFVADTRCLSAATGWQATIGWRDGLRDLAEWMGAEFGLPVPATKPQKRRMRA